MPDDRPSKPVAPHAEPDHRSRLLEGMAQAVSEQRYADVTIADVVRRARVSKRTFYEHFPDKEACFLATYMAVSADLLRRIADAAASKPPGEEQLEAATSAYFQALDERRPLVRAFLSEIHAAGPAALAMRRQIHQRFAETLRSLVEHARKARPEIRPLSPELATVIVGGINELILSSIEGGRADRLPELGRTATELIRLVLMAPTDSLSRPHEKHRP